MISVSVIFLLLFRFFGDCLVRGSLPCFLFLGDGVGGEFMLDAVGSIVVDGGAAMDDSNKWETSAKDVMDAVLVGTLDDVGISVLVSFLVLLYTVAVGRELKKPKEA